MDPLSESDLDRTWDNAPPTCPDCGGPRRETCDGHVHEDDCPVVQPYEPDDDEAA